MFKRAACFGFMLWVFIACQDTSFGQASSDTLLNKRISNLEIESGSVNAALSAIAIAFKAPIGVELRHNDAYDKGEKIKLSLRDVTLQQALEEALKLASNYEWHEVDGVINVYPTKSRDFVLKELLETRISFFFLQKDKSKLDVRNEITELPEVKAKLDELKLSSVNIASRSSDFKGMGVESEMRFSDTSLRSILNQIIKKSGSRYWVIGRFGEANSLFTIRFL